MPRRRIRRTDGPQRNWKMWAAARKPGMAGRTVWGSTPGGGGQGAVARGRSGQNAKVRIEHITLHAEASQTIASGGAAIAWDRIAAAPTEIRGFRSCAEEIADTGQVVAIPIDVAGFAIVGLRLPLTARVTATCTIELIRDGVTSTIVEAVGTGKIVKGAKAFWARPRDRVKVTITSATGVTLSAAGSTPLIEIEVWEHADVTSRLTGYREVVLADTPLAYWKLDEASGTVAHDASGNDNHGTYTNSPTLGVTGLMLDGVGATAVRFSRASAETVSIGDLSDFEFGGTAPFTVEAWVSLTTGPGSGEFYTVVQKYQPGGSPTRGWEMLAINGPQFSFQRRQDGATSHIVTSGAVTIGTTYHVVVTYDGTTLTMYLNGAVVDTDATAVSLSTGSDPLVIAGQDIDGDFMNGTIDEVSIYDRALTADEIGEHYAVGTKAA